MRETYRILDANFNRAREALRVVEDCGRFALNDPAITAMAKNLRSDLKEILQELPVTEMITSRDTPGDIGTEITSPSEPQRSGLADVAIAACKRLSESLRTIEEYLKFVSPEQVLRVERMRYNGYTLEQRLVGRLMIPSRFSDVKLYVLVTSSMCPGCVRERVRATLAGGADAIQLREKEVSDAAFLAMAAELRELTDETSRRSSALTAYTSDRETSLSPRPGACCAPARSSARAPTRSDRQRRPPMKAPTTSASVRSTPRRPKTPGRHWARG